MLYDLIPPQNCNFNCLMSRFNYYFFRFRDYFSSKLNIVDACVVVITLVVTMIYTFTDLTGTSLIPRYILHSAHELTDT